MTSRRLPGKVTAPLRGRPMLLYLVERLTRTGHEATICTSTDGSDEPVAELCARESIPCFRGSLDDVAGRMLAAARDTAAEAFVRLSGDSPLLDPALVDRAVSRMRESRPDIATNVWPVRSFPKGQSVEVVRTDAFARACAVMTEADDREHVTPWMYRNARNFRIEGFTADEDRSAVQLSIDTADDFARIEAILGRMTGPHWTYGWRDLVAINAEVEATT